MAAGFLLVQRTKDRTLREDSKRISDINAYLIRAMFWAVLIVGSVDTIISFLRVDVKISQYLIDCDVFNSRRCR